MAPERPGQGFRARKTTLESDIGDTILRHERQPFGRLLEPQSPQECQRGLFAVRLEKPCEMELGQTSNTGEIL